MFDRYGLCGYLWNHVWRPFINLGIGRTVAQNPLLPPDLFVIVIINKCAGPQRRPLNFSEKSAVPVGTLFPHTVLLSPANIPASLPLSGRMLRGFSQSPRGPSRIEPQLPTKVTWSFMHPLLASSLSLPHFLTGRCSLRSFAEQTTCT